MTNAIKSNYKNVKEYNYLMTTKKKCDNLAADHGITIEVEDFGHQKYSNVNLPEGYQFGIGDDQRGLTIYYEKPIRMSEVWSEVFKDIQTLIDGKAYWVKADE
jgi:hypothetical protein